MTGKHIELFLVDGVPGGLTTAEIAGWTGHVLSGPRADLAEVLNRGEAQRNGTYLLLGNDDAAVGGTRCYVGRTENFINRFRDHLKKKLFWDRVVLITAKDDGFNEGHWGYLEARLVELARQANRVSLENDQTPQGRKLSEAQASDMEAFLTHLQIILPVLGVNALRTRPTKPELDAGIQAKSPVFELVGKKQRVDARAQLFADEFTMLEGSHVVARWAGVGKTANTQRSYANLRAQHERLLADGSIVVENGIGVLTRDVAFTSPSTAGAIALGRSCNGRVEWTWSGGSYGRWEQRGLDE